MEDKKLNELSDETLLRQEKLIKAVTGGLVGALIVLLIMAVVLCFRQGFNALVIMPFALLPIVLFNLNKLKEIRQELNARKVAS